MTGVLLKGGCCGEACCLPDGTCEDLLPEICRDRGGVPQGCGTTCEDINCVDTQACCFDDGNCSDLPPAECRALGGTPQGKGTRCLDAQCGPCEDCTIPPCSLEYLVSAPSVDLLCNGEVECHIPAHSEVLPIGCIAPNLNFDGPVGNCGGARWDSLSLFCFQSPPKWRLHIRAQIPNFQNGSAVVVFGNPNTTVCPNGNYVLGESFLACDIVGTSGPATVV